MTDRAATDRAATDRAATSGAATSGAAGGVVTSGAAGGAATGGSGRGRRGAAGTPAEVVLAPPVLTGRPRRADAATLLCLFVLTLTLIPARMVIRGLPVSLSVASVLALAAGLMWLCAQLTGTLGAAKGRNPVRTLVFLYVASAAASYGYGTYGYLPADELNLADQKIVLVLANAGLALAVCDGVRARERLDFVLRTVVAGGAIMGLVGAAQFLLNVDVTQYLRLPGLRFAIEEAFVFDRNAMRRVAATAAHPIEFGVLCAMILPLAAHYGFRARELGRPALRWWLCTASIGMGLMFSVSRSAVLALAGVGFVLLLGWPARRRVQAVAVLAGFLVVVRMIAPGLLGTIFGLFANFFKDSSIDYRTHDYAVAAEEIAKHPWLGRAIGTWYAPKYQIFDNQYIQGAIDTGIIGVAIFLGLFVCAFVCALRARRLGADPGVRELGLVLASCLVAPVLGAATYDLATYAHVTGLAFLLIGATGALARMAGDERRGDHLPLQTSGRTREVTR
ncbi:MAG TPA: O-antigen ligase family protein [Nonomuraea sp.]|nr:O-antigen ligase family protein [Nonomuraea sp.]